MSDVVQEQVDAPQALVEDDSVVERQEATRQAAAERVGKRREREPDFGWTAQEGPKPETPDEVGHKVLPHQLPDPQVAIEAGIPPQQIPPTVVDADDPDEVIRRYQEGESPDPGRRASAVHPRSGESFNPGAPEEL